MIVLIPNNQKNHRICLPWRYLLLLLSVIYFSQTVSADVVILKSGDTFNTSKAWEDNGKVKFYMQDLIVSVPIKDVAKIIKGDGSQSPLPPPGIEADEKKPRKLPKKPIRKNKPVKSKEKPYHPPLEKDTPRKTIPKRKTSPSSSGNHLGFRGLHWKMDRSQFKGFVKSKTDDGVDLYYDPDDSYRFGTAFVDGIMYGFIREKLYSITIWSDGKRRYKKLKAETIKHYGEGMRKDESKERFIWSDATTDRLLEFDKEINTGLLWMRSHQMAKEIQ